MGHTSFRAMGLTTVVTEAEIVIDADVNVLISIALGRVRPRTR